MGSLPSRTHASPSFTHVHSRWIDSLDPNNAYRRKQCGQSSSPRPAGGCDGGRGLDRNLDEGFGGGGT